MTTEILILLLLFQIKHLVADYYLQFPYMYENKGQPTKWIIPLFDHAAIHALGTSIIIFLYFMYTAIPTKIGGEFALLITIGAVIFDGTSHFIIDRWKATRKTDPTQSKFWQYLGIDQMLHHIIGILIIWFITTQGA